MGDADGHARHVRGWFGIVGRVRGVISGGAGHVKGPGWWRMSSMFGMGRERSGALNVPLVSWEAELDQFKEALEGAKRPVGGFTVGTNRRVTYGAGGGGGGTMVRTIMESAGHSAGAETEAGVTERTVCLSESELLMLVELTREAVKTGWDAGDTHRKLAKALYQPGEGAARGGSVRVQLVGYNGPAVEFVTSAARGAGYQEFYTVPVQVSGVNVVCD